MGFFDLLNPLFDTVDGLFQGWLPATGRIALWSLVGALVSMFCYRAFSSQEKLAALKPELARAQKAMAEFDGELSEIAPLLRRSLGLALRQFGLALGPALLASIPLIFILAWCSNRFDTVPPAPGDAVPFELVGASADLAWNPPVDGQALIWPEPGESVRLQSDGGTLIELPGEGLSPVIHKRQWWNTLIGNPAGYLPDDAPLEAVQFDYRTREYLAFGPGWVRGWEFLFIGLLFAFSIVIKIAFRIH